MHIAADRDRFLPAGRFVSGQNDISQKDSGICEKGCGIAEAFARMVAVGVPVARNARAMNAVSPTPADQPPMTHSVDDTGALLDLAAQGNAEAVDQLLADHRQRLIRMIDARMDPRMLQRVDASDVVQETMAVAANRLPQYLCERPIPFYPWLRQIAWQKLVDLQRRHVQADKRSVRHEVTLRLPDESHIKLADRLIASGPSPSVQLMRSELRRRLRAALDQLKTQDREVLVLLYLEQLSIQEVAAVVGLSDRAVTMRHLRALERLRPLLR